VGNTKYSLETQAFCITKRQYHSLSRVTQFDLIEKKQKKQKKT